MKKIFASLIVCTLLFLAFAVPASAVARVDRENEKQALNLGFPVYLCEEPLIV
jgi:hypothetical protein